MPTLPEPIVLSAAATEIDLTTAETIEEIATVGFVRRVVDSRLPPGVATVAAGPLVVLVLIVDAVKAAGGLLLAPWLLLAVYMTGLLRGWRAFTEPN
ncbi:MAG: hypothetical protein HKP18_06395 [Acidimicrobiia bacterium]|nr:hypothetical protein [Acidimicrobiia bacterium]